MPSLRDDESKISQHTLSITIIRAANGFIVETKGSEEYVYNWKEQVKKHLEPIVDEYFEQFEGEDDA